VLEIIFTVVVYLAGAITEHETKGAITKSIMYKDGNVTLVECKGA